ncbi:MAG: hypothetical protein IJ752_05820 [Alphaproteobacteria bacterium]|nr:hypothetical protein [Alphaproteobacteria bacterium]
MAAISQNLLSLQQKFEVPVVRQEYDPKARLAVDVDISICTEEERPRMISIVNRLAKSEAGRETLEIAAKAGCKFGFLDSSKQSFGTYFSNGFIGLGPNASDDKLVSTLCHESRHAGQAVRMGHIPGRSDLNVASIIRYSCAKEADAQAYAVKACKELEMQGDTGPLATFAKFYPPIYAAYEKALAEQNGVMNDKVVAGTFKGWYDQNETKQKYEENYILTSMHRALKAFDQGMPGVAYSFKENVTSEEIVSLVGWTKNGSYLAGEDPKFLDQDHFLSIGERTKKDAEDFFKMREEKTGIPKDSSLENMPTRKDAFARRLPEMGKPLDDQKAAANDKTMEKWRAALAGQQEKKPNNSTKQAVLMKRLASKGR